uniref:Tick transposon n=1 Tax=Rhipicephalus appendiculatus TaxID=34631 RepID=A0A131YPE3_RHIAP
MNIHAGRSEQVPNMTFRLPAKIKRHHASLLHRIRLGVAFTRRYAHLIGRVDSPNCERCPVVETLTHLLCDCPLYVSQRKMLVSTLAGIGVNTLSETNILSAMSDQTASRTATRALIDFMKNTGLDSRL